MTQGDEPDPGPTGSEYEADRKISESRARLGGLIAFGVLLLLCLNAYGTFIVNPASRKQSDEEIRFGQYEVCRKSGNVLRGQVRAEFVDLKRRVLIPVFADVAATISPDSPAHEILTEAVRYLKMRIATIDERIPDANCAELYPPLEGQTYPTS